jgi:hypothetical protein
LALVAFEIKGWFGKREVAGEEDLRAQEEKRKQEGADDAGSTGEWEKEELDAVE